MIDDHGDAVISDLSEYHGLDLVEVLAEHTHSPRSILARLRWLPDNSALSASFRGEPRGWGQDRHLAATLVDALQQNSWITAAVATKRKPPKPKALQRPKSTKTRARVVRVADLMKGG